MKTHKQNVSFKANIDGKKAKVILKPLNIQLPESDTEAKTRWPNGEFLSHANAEFARSERDHYRSSVMPKDRTSISALLDFMAHNMTSDNFKEVQNAAQKIHRLTGTDRGAAINTLLDKHLPKKDSLKDNPNVAEIIFDV